MKKELTRKLFHIIFGIFFILVIYFFGTLNSLIIISILFLIGLITGLAIKKGFRFHHFTKIISFIEREHEKHFPGKAALVFFFAAIILLFFFQNEPLIALAALSTQIFADAFAAIIGKRFGKHIIIQKKHYKKTLEGTIACFVVAAIVLLFFIPTTLFYVIVIAAICATITEFAPINDNLAMPLVVAFVLKLLL